MTLWKQKLSKRAETLKNEIWAISMAMKDPRTPWALKLFAGAIIAYALSPIDLVPDFIPILGWLDDLILLPLAIGLLLRALPREVLSDCRQLANDNPRASTEQILLAALFIVSVWAAAAIATYSIISKLRKP